MRSRAATPLALLLAAGLGLAGCASSPPAESPALGVELPAQWTANRLEDRPPAAQPTDEWWKTFADPTLDSLVVEALERNRDLAAAADRVAAAAAQATIAGADLTPHVGFSFDPARGRRNFIGFPIPGQEGGVLSTTTTTFSSGFNVSWELDLWGRLRAQAGAGLANLEAAEDSYEGARLSLAGQTAKAWFAVLEATAQVDLAQETLASREVTARQIRRRYELGLRGPLDLRLALASEAGARASLEARQQQLDASRRRLDLLASRYPDGELGGDREIGELPALPAPIPAGIPSEIITRRPDLQAAERRLAASGMGVQQARAALYPQIRLTASAGRVSGDIEDLLDDDFSVWNLAAGILQPILQGGRLRAGVDLAEARYSEVTQSYVQTVLAAFGEVETLLAAERFLSGRQEALAAAAEQSLAAQRLAEERYAAGLADYLLVLQSQRDATLARSTNLTVRRELLDTRVDLHLALGGDFGS